MTAPATSTPVADRMPRMPLRFSGLQLLLIPAVVIGLVLVSPVAYLLIRVAEADQDAIDLIFNSRTVGTLSRSLQLMVVVCVASLAVSLPLAWLTVCTDIPWRRFWAIATALPLVIPSYVGAMAVVEALGPRGMAQGWLEPLGVDRLPDIYGLHGAAFTITILSYPYVLLSLRTALWGMDPSLEESSRMLGHSRWSTFFHVTLPQLRPAAAAGSLLVALYTMSDFGAVALLRFSSFTLVIYNQYQLAFDRTLAAATALVLVAVALVLVVMEAASRGRSRYYKPTSGASRRSNLVQLGRWRWPAAAFCGLMVLVSLAMPLGILLKLFLDGVAAGETFDTVWQATWHSIQASGLAMIVTVLAAIPIVVLSVRRGGRFVWLLERSSYMGFALPGIVVALALVFLGIRFVNPIYQTMYLLVLGYVILFFPVAFGTLRTSLLQVNPHLEEAARSLGRGGLRTFSTITLPLLRAGIVTGCALVFLLTMKELPATLILGPAGYKTLATMTWSDAEAALLARSALSGMMLILAAAVPMAAIIYWERRDQW